MLLRLKRTLLLGISGLLSFTTLSCVENIFVPPPDLFVKQRLEPNPRSITFGSGSNALIIKTNKANVTDTEHGIRIRGSLFIQNKKYGDIRLTSGDFVLLKASSKNLGKYFSPEYGELPVSRGLFKSNDESGTEYVGFAGYGLVELPNQGIVKNLQVLGVDGAPIGFIKGSELKDWPVGSDNYYFFMNLESGVKVEVGKSSLSGVKRIAIDPLDPYFYVSCDFEGSTLGPITNIGFAVSAQGFIPFNPLIDIYKLPSFNGNLYLTGTVSLTKFPVSIMGETVIGFNVGDPRGSEKFFNGEDVNLDVGLNGEATLEHDLLEILDFDIVLGQASLYFMMKESGDAELNFIGVVKTPAFTPSEMMYKIIGVDWKFLDYIVPQRSETTLYATIGTEPSDWELGFKQKSFLDILGKWKLDMGETFLEIDSDHMAFKGESSVAGFVRVGVEGEVHKNGDFKLTGYKKKGFTLNWGRLYLSFRLGMNLTVALQDKVFTMRGKFNIGGKACVEILEVDVCAEMSLNAEASISTNGNFELKFRIGIGKLGFDVKINFSFDEYGNSIETMTYEEIPIEMVPLENRFQPQTGANELPGGIN